MRLELILQSWIKFCFYFIQNINVVQNYTLFILTYGILYCDFASGAERFPHQDGIGFPENEFFVCFYEI